MQEQTKKHVFYIGYYLLDLKPENLVTWTSCLIPLAATRPGSCLMVAWAEPEEIAAEARVARGSAKISMKCSNYFFECSRGKLEYMILKFKFQTQIYSHIMKFNKFINVLTLILCLEIKIRMKNKIKICNIVLTRVCYRCVHRLGRGGYHWGSHT